MALSAIAGRMPPCFYGVAAALKRRVLPLESGTAATPPTLLVVQICRRISPDRRAAVSAHELMAAVRRDRALACLLFPAPEVRGILASEERAADAVDAVFREVAEGGHRARMSDLAAYLDSQRYLRLCEQIIDRSSALEPRRAGSSA
ncbi:unnamed protein product [Prorocentrum cordatum]|uniref:Uncharacterized protein n=1 Tax=Prorocentrum cordatum TaxID=2364126 RepID=A0ABN9W190_9DINO|nr:unnamed protein product [Polarella glacialis]